MSRKDYIAIARVIAEAEGQPDSRSYIARELAVVLANDNPRFRRVQFLDACKVED